MLPGMELMACPNLAVPREVMHHVVRVESSYNPYAIGVVGGRLVRQPRTLPEALSTARMLEERGYNFSLGLAQVNRYNLVKYGLHSYEKAFHPCSNLVAGSQILRECYGRSGGDWGKSFSCYYSGDFRTGYRHGYVQKVYASMRRGNQAQYASVAPIQVIDRAARRSAASAVVARNPTQPTGSLAERRGMGPSPQPMTASQAAPASPLTQTPSLPGIPPQPATPARAAAAAPTATVVGVAVPTASLYGQGAAAAPSTAVAAAPAASAAPAGDTAFVF